MERKNPPTSIAAHKSVSIEMRNNHFSKIIKALKQMGSGSAEQIADHLGMSHTQVNRRMIELERLEVAYRPGGKTLTKTKRRAFLWVLRGSAMPVTNTQEKLLKGKSISEYSKSISKISQQVRQESLFD